MSMVLPANPAVHLAGFADVAGEGGLATSDRCRHPPHAQAHLSPHEHGEPRRRGGEAAMARVGCDRHAQTTPASHGHSIAALAREARRLGGANRKQTRAELRFANEARVVEIRFEEAR